jgi:hypothetical protein
MTHLGDRRARDRFEVVGILAGAVEFVERGRVVDISRLGLSIACQVAPPINSIFIVQLVLDGDEVSAHVRVRHVRPAGDGQGSQYMVGLEFLSSSSRLESAIDRVVGPPE